MMAKVFLMHLIAILSVQSLCAQVSPKFGAIKKHKSTIKHIPSGNTKPLQVSLLQGIWSDKSENNAIFYIEGKHVKFFDHIGDDTKEYQQTYWNVLNNKISFYYSGGLVITDAIIKLTKDSLVLYRKDIGTSRYVRLK